MVIDATGNRRKRLPPELLMIPHDASVCLCVFCLYGEISEEMTVAQCTFRAIHF